MSTAERLSYADYRNAYSFHDNNDYLRDVLGAALENNTEEVYKIVEDIQQKGGSITFYDNYPNMITNVKRHESAEIKLDKNASIGAVRHEYRHFLDDYDLGMPSLAYYLSNLDLFFDFERRGYLEEIEIAKKLGYDHIVKKVEQQIEDRRKEVYGL